MPDEHSAIIVDDFTSLQKLVDLIVHLNHDDHDYNQYLAYKVNGVTNQNLLDVMARREWGADNPVDKPNFVTATECFVCRRIHDNIRRAKAGQPTRTYIADVSHYGCPKPLAFRDAGVNDLERVESESIAYEWTRTRYEARALKEFWTRGWYNFSSYDLASRMTQLRYEAGDAA